MTDSFPAVAGRMGVNVDGRSTRMVRVLIFHIEIYGMKRPTVGLLVAILLSFSVNASAGPCDRQMIYSMEGSFCEGCGAGHSFGCWASTLAYERWLFILCTGCNQICQSQVESVPSSGECAPSASTDVETAGAEVFGDFSIDLANSVGQLNELAVIDPAHAIFTMQFAEGLRVDRQVDRYTQSYLSGTPTFAFYETALATLISGAQESGSLKSAASALTTPVEKGVIRAEGWISDSSENNVTLRVRTAIVDTPGSSPPTLETARSLEKAFEIRELLNETLITLTKVEGLDSVYVISRVMADPSPRNL